MAYCNLRSISVEFNFCLFFSLRGGGSCPEGTPSIQLATHILCFETGVSRSRAGYGELGVNPGTSFVNCSQGGWFPLFLFVLNLLVRTIMGHCSAVASVFWGFVVGSSVSSAPVISDWIRSFFIFRSPCHPLVSTWIRSAVLRLLSGAPLSGCSPALFFNGLCLD